MSKLVTGAELARRHSIVPVSKSDKLIHLLKPVIRPRSSSAANSTLTSYFKEQLLLESFEDKPRTFKTSPKNEIDDVEMGMEQPQYAKIISAMLNNIGEQMIWQQDEL